MPTGWSVDADLGIEAHRGGVGPAGRDQHELVGVAGDLLAAPLIS